MTKSELNKFFNKIYIINLFDNIERWKKVSGQFKRRKIAVDRFIAVDGRCKKQGWEACEEKRKNFEMVYNVKIPDYGSVDLPELIPAASLTIGTILILREMVKKKWKHVLICEDDISLIHGFEKKFKEGVKELKKVEPNWDILYLSGGLYLGTRGISETKKKGWYKSSVAERSEEKPYWVKYKDDIRGLCPEKKCPILSKHLSKAAGASGTFAYAVSLKAAKKILKEIDNDAAAHIDHILRDMVKDKQLKAVCFDPPICFHDDGAWGAGLADIPWAW
jgi:GR25 family glycosyltransferase involved in LPS biosynthesis